MMIYFLDKIIPNGSSFTLTHIEHTLIRIFFAVYLYLVYPFSVPYHEQPYPHGLAQYINLTLFGDPNIHAFLQVGIILSLVFYCFGRFMIVNLVFLLMVTIGPVTLLYSQGYINHSLHIFPLILLGQLMAYSYSKISQILGKRFWDKGNVENMAFFFSKQMLASIYVVAGISKLAASHGTWPLQALNLAPYVIRNHAQEYYANLEPGLLEIGERISSLITDNPEFFVILFGIALLTELLAFLAVYSKFLAFVVGIGLILMHEGIGLTMSVTFRHNEVIIFVFFILPFLTQRITSSWKIFGESKPKSTTRIPKKIPSFIYVLNRIPLKLTIFIVALGLIVHEWYPFSSFALYTKLSPQTYYYYITDQNNKPISFRKEFGLSDPVPVKMIETRIRQKKTFKVVDESEIGKQFLRYLITIRVPKPPPKYQLLQLWKAVVYMSNKSLVKQEHKVASITIPYSL